MSFLYPSFFFALAVFAIPIAVHLFNFRRYKRVEFTNVRFLKSVTEETRSAQRLKHLLVLFCRLLALFFLVAAFAQPYLPGKQKATAGDATVTGFYIDNSFSMRAESEEGVLFEVAKNKIREVISSGKSNDRYFLLSNNSLSGQHLVNRQELEKQLDDLDFTPRSLQMSQVLAKATATFEKNGATNREFFIVSDMQHGMLNFSEGQNADTTYNLYVLPLSPETRSNISIDSVWLSSPVIQPDVPAQVVVKLRNHGKDDVNSVSVTFFLNGVQKAAGVLDIQAGASATLPLDLLVKSTGWQRAEVRIQDHPVVFDDHYYFTFPVRKEVPVYGIFAEKQEPFIPGLFSTDPYYKFSGAPVNQTDYAALKKSDFIVLQGLSNLSSGLNAEINAALSRGASVLFTPPTQSQEQGWMSWLTQYGITGVSKSAKGNYPANSINVKDPLFSNVFEKIPSNMNLPFASEYYRLEQNGNARALISFSNGDPMVLAMESGKGKLYISSVPLDDDWTNFHRHAIFVPLVLRMTFYHRNEYNISSVLGNSELIKIDSEIKSDEGGLKLRKDNFEMVPELYTRENENFISDQGLIEISGIYELGAGEKTQPIAFNYNHNESGQQFATSDDLDKYFAKHRLTMLSDSKKHLGESLKQLRRGTILWKWCVVGVLIFLLFEILLLKLWPNKRKPAETTLST